jgi:site-specific DNA-adenine methylase
MQKKKKQIKISKPKKIQKFDIISEFPENYKELVYCEPFCGCCGTFLRKEQSKISILNDVNVGIYTLIKTLQNNEKHFSNKIKSIKFNQSTFKSELNKKEFKNEIEYSINQYILHRMSRASMCKTYSWSSSKKNQTDCCSWNTSIDNFSLISEKLNGVFVYNKPAIEILKNFNCDNAFLYCDMPCYCGSKCIKTAYKPEMDEKDHIEFSKLVLKFNGKILLHNLESNFYKKLYKNLNRKKIINKNRVEYIWKNF